MNTLTVDLPAELHDALSSEAWRRNVTRASLVRAIIENALVRGTSAAAPSCADPAGDLVGAVRSGRSDLATNRGLLDEAGAGDLQRRLTDGSR